MTAPPVGQQWYHQMLERDADMHAKIDIPLNEVQTLIAAARTNGMPRLRVALTTGGGTWASGSMLPFDTVLEDTAGGWSASTHQYTLPVNRGLWLMQGQVRTTAVGALEFTPLPTITLTPRSWPIYPASVMLGLVPPNGQSAETNPVVRFPGTPLFLQPTVPVGIENVQGATLTLVGRQTISSVVYENTWLSLFQVALA